MSKHSRAVLSIPPRSLKYLEEFGYNLKIARKRRNRSLRSWAASINVSVPTLQRMEKGDPTVSMGVYLTVMFFMGWDKQLPDLVAPDKDVEALNMEVYRKMMGES